MDVPSHFEEHFLKPYKDRGLVCDKCKVLYIEHSRWRLFAARCLKIKTRCALHRGRWAHS